MLVNACLLWQWYQYFLFKLNQSNEGSRAKAGLRLPLIPHVYMERPTLQGLFQLRQEEYLRVSPLALFVYDYLVTFGDEVTFIWTKPKSLGTILYFLARYPVFVDLVLSLYIRITPRLPVDQCIALDHAMGWMFLIGIAVAKSQSMSLSPGERTS
ncbi:hypothetical protein PLEOSDRAFT_1101120 [Pleurotus ostreatus PC15]|uniref:DUF6533 domain-containing protein n=1 Tax=Pleurotus ostreatus (strain PC15) TaxID=1137138 RepID=A0A067NPV4_PLEO1|nr:hypothetical protein PLEOSDRAFT_1101120 [Pleurotus ostreatus PC15]